jgi:hypothetical protein
MIANNRNNICNDYFIYIYYMIDLYYIGGTKHTILTPMKHMKMPLFSDNSRVYQKPGTYHVGAGSIQHSRIKSRRI